jgi:hypothetical protein
MASPTIKVKRSSVAGKIPTTSQIDLGELAINTFDGKVYIEQDQSSVGIGTTVIVINPWSVGTGTNTYNTYFTAGNVGVGSTLPTSNLDVNGNAKFTGIVTASSLFGSGINLTGIVTSITAGSGISISQSTGNIIITATGGGGIAATTYTTSQTVTATEGQTSFTFNEGYTQGFVDVYLNGIRLITGTDYTATNGSTVTLTSGATAGDEIEMVAFKSLGNVVNINNFTSAGSIQVSGVITATSFVKSGGTSSQFLKADGSVDNATYATQSYVGLATAGLAPVSYVDSKVGLSTVGLASVSYVDSKVGLSTVGLASVSYVDSKVGLATVGLLASTGNGSNLTGIVTSIIAGTNITISGSTGQVTINASGGSASATLDILEVMMFS